MMRVGVLHGGVEVESEKAVPPSQRLRILRASEIREVWSFPLSLLSFPWESGADC